MRKTLCMVLSLVLLAAAMTTAGATRLIEPESWMMLDGKNVFDYTSGELFALMKERGGSTAAVGYVDYTGKKPEEKVPGLSIPIGQVVVTAYSDDTDAAANRESLMALPLAKTKYRVSSVQLLGPSEEIAPFGIAVGMPIADALKLAPEAESAPLGMDAFQGDENYTMPFVDETADGMLMYRLDITSNGGVVTRYTVTSESFVVGRGF